MHTEEGLAGIKHVYSIYLDLSAAAVIAKSPLHYFLLFRGATALLVAAVKR